MYKYHEVKPRLFTESGQVMFLRIRDTAHKLLHEAGAFQMDRVMVGTGSTWDMIACVDRMVELGEIRELTTPGSVAGQHRVFVRS